MKWPESLMMVRRGESAYNVLKALNQDYIESKKAYI